MGRIGRLFCGISLGLAIAFAAVDRASADTTYTYVGNDFTHIFDSDFPPGSYTTDMQVSGSLTLASALAPDLVNEDISGSVLSFDFTDGRQSFTEATDLPVKVFRVSTSGGGQITSWLVNFSTAQGFPRNTISTENRFIVRDRGEMIFLLSAQDKAEVTGSPGAWSLEIGLDIKPGGPMNAINLTGEGLIPVAILGSDGFDVTDVDVTTLAFGPGGAPPAHAVGGHLEDVNGDEFMDLVSHYGTQEAGLAPGDAAACVSGETLDGRLLLGCDSVVAFVPCGIGFELALLMPPLLWLRRRLRARR